MRLLSRLACCFSSKEGDTPTEGYVLVAVSRRCASQEPGSGDGVELHIREAIEAQKSPACLRQPDTAPGTVPMDAPESSEAGESPATSAAHSSSGAPQNSPALPTTLLAPSLGRSFSQRVQSQRSRLALCTRADDGADALPAIPSASAPEAGSAAVEAAHHVMFGGSGNSTSPSPFVAAGFQWEPNLAPASGRAAPPDMPAPALLVSWVLGAHSKAYDEPTSASARASVDNTPAPGKASPVTGDVGIAHAAVSPPLQRQAAPGAKTARAALLGGAGSGRRRRSASCRRLPLTCSAGRTSGSSAGSFVAATTAAATATAAADPANGTALAPAPAPDPDPLQAAPILHAHAEAHHHYLDRLGPGPQWHSAEGLLGSRVLDTQLSFGADVSNGAAGLGPPPRVAGVSPLLLASVGMMLASSMSEPAWTSGTPDECFSSAAGTHHTPTGGGTGHGSEATAGTAGVAAAAAAPSSSVGGRPTGAATRRGSGSDVPAGADVAADVAAAAAAAAAASSTATVSTVAAKGAAVSPQSMQVDGSALSAAGSRGDATTQSARDHATAASCSASSGGFRALDAHQGGSERSDAGGRAAGFPGPVPGARHQRGGAVSSGAGGGGSLAAHPATPPSPSAGLAMVHVYPLRASRPQVPMPAGGAGGGAGAVHAPPHSDTIPRCSAAEAAAAAAAAVAPVSVSESCLASTVANSGAEGMGAVAGSVPAAGRDGRAATWATALRVAAAAEGAGQHAAATDDEDSEFSVGGDVEGGPRWRCADVAPAYLSHNALADAPAAPEAPGAPAAAPVPVAGTMARSDADTTTCTGGSTCQGVSLNPPGVTQGGDAGGGAGAPAPTVRALQVQMQTQVQMHTMGSPQSRSGRPGEASAADAGDRAAAATAIISGGAIAMRSGGGGSGAGGVGPPRSSMRLAVFPGHQASWLALQMHFFGGVMGAGGALEPRVPLSALASLDIARLSREVSALVWIGQGGGGAVFQGLWQGARVAVKFLLAASPAHVDATALEAIVSLSVAHPNVVHTYCAEVARVDEASLAEPAAGVRARRGSVAGFAAAGGAARLSSTAGGGHDGPDEDAAVTALYNALIMETAEVPPPAPPQPSSSKVSSGVSDGVVPPQHLPPAAPSGEAAAPVPATGVVRRSSSSGSSTVGGAGSSGSAAEGVASQRLRLPPPVADSHATTSFFESHEGFGEPDPASHDRAWSLRQVLNYLRARPQMYLTHIIMEYCDRGSLLGAIKRGIFRLEAHGVTEAAELTGVSSESSRRSTAHSSKEGWAATVAAASSAASGGGGGRAGLTPIPEACAETGRFPRRVVLRAILRTARDVAQGMAHLHANGIIHGDLKPGNVLLRGCRSDRRGFVAAVADFGLSKVVRGDQPLELDRWSTVTVMAPETIQGRWHKASDVYAFGILLWQLVSSEVVPYGNLTVGQILLGVSQGTLRPEWPTGAHPALIRLGRACLATNANERPSFYAIAKVLTKIETGVRNELREQQRQQQRTQHEQQQQREQLAVPAFASEGDHGQRPASGGSNRPYSRKYSAV